MGFRRLKRFGAAFGLVGILYCAGASAQENLVTVRVGEQDTCDITGVTTVLLRGSSMPNRRWMSLSFRRTTFC